MNCVLIFPPQWIPFNPHLATPAIQSILKNNGNKVYLRDLNIEFYNTILSQEFIAKSLKRAFDDFNLNAGAIFSQYSDKKPLKEYPLDFQNRFIKYRSILNLSKENRYNQIIEKLPNSLRVIKDKKDFYNPYLLDKSIKNIHDVTNLLSTIYSPSKINFLNVQVQIYDNLEFLTKQCLDKDSNIFYHFYEDKIGDLLSSNPTYIGISLGDYTQLVPGLTLAMMLKSRTKAHINIGGNLFGRYTDVLINNIDFFNLFADSIIYNEGEKPTIELLKYLNGEIPIENVPNLIYVKENKVQINEAADPYAINDIYTPDFSNLPLNKYYTPEVIYNVQASRDCYWRKCSFCTHYFGSKYAIKNIDKTVSELKDLYHNYNARYFHFIDEAMSPAYLRKLSTKIIEEGLDINFYIYGRLEKEFNLELFKLARQAGLRMIMWGFESANERIYKLMNKGVLTNIYERQQILKDAYEADVWNYLFVMFGFPSESLEEAKETVHFLYANRNLASYSTGSKFALLENSSILKNLEKYTITKVERIKSGFSYAHRFEAYKGMNSSQVKELDSYKADYWKLAKLKYSGSSYREKLFLYICKYGTKNISKMRDKIWL